MPVLIYPCRVFDYGAAGNGQMRSPRPDQMTRDDSGMFFDLGVYGVPLCVAAPAAPPAAADRACADAVPMPLLVLLACSC